MASYTNQATLRYNGITLQSNIARGEVLTSITMTKTAVRGSYAAAGDNVTYVLSLINNSASVVSGITVTDYLGGFIENGATLYPLAYVADSIMYYQNGVLQPDPAVTAGPPLIITGVTVPANGNVTLLYETTVTRYAPLGQAASITNTATVTGMADPITASETVLAVNAPRLSITKFIRPVPVAEDGEVTYTFVIQNAGNTATDAADGVQITDLFNPILSNLSVELDGVAFTAYSYNEGTGLFETTAGSITVPAATYTRDTATNVVSVTPGTVTLTVVGNI